ncbi:diflavin oxidoreductase [Niabella digestorum]|uniref:Flavodoxin domain-containing protein n=1 Tax=Niabella digestorum TaxID=3117701 RepID=A0ABU7RCR6_9BACT
MLSEDKLQKIKEFTATLSREELIWLNGYIAGQAGALQGAIAAAPAPLNKKITLVYGTETGNAKKLATQLAGIAKKKGVTVKLAGLDQYRLSDLTKEEYFFVVISTQGEGEPPLLAKKFYDHIHEALLDLKKMKFGVLALGDSSYAQFCKTGEDVDARLEALGGHRILPLKKCDVDYEEDALHWIENVIAALQTNVGSVPVIARPAVEDKKPAGKKSYKGTVVTNINLNDRGSNKETYHIEISTEEDIDYVPGDALGIIPPNNDKVVDEIIQLTGIDENKEIATAKVTASVRELLKKHLNIMYPLKSTIKQYAEITGHDVPQEARIGLLDLLKIYPVKDAAMFEEVIKILTSQAPRMYSISSSPSSHGLTEVHITVSKDEYYVGDEKRTGVCSEFFSTVPVGAEIEFFIQKQKHFRLPDPDKDVIMIGPGTGIAPFRSFIAERDAIGASGRNWLFFGEQHFLTDFLYQVEWQAYLQTGTLSRLDLAFSRDQEEKIYVQHRMKQKGAELYEWLQNGAYMYISGKREPTSKDVERALVEIFMEHGNKTQEEAEKYLHQLAEEGRWEKDVY